MAYFRKRNNNTWEYRISYKDSTGNNKIKSKSGFKTKTEAKQFALEAELMLSNDTMTDKNVLISDFFDRWAEIHKRPHISEVTWQKYKQTKKHIEMYMPNIKIIDITATYYQEVLNQFGQKYSQETIENFHYHIKSAMKIAVHEKIIDANFADFAKAKSQKQPRSVEDKFLQEDEYLSLINETESNIKYKSYFTLYLIAVTGLRFAEALGLTWDDIDWEADIISINKTWNYSITNDWADTKNEASKRKVPISNKTLDLLRDYQSNFWEFNECNRIIFGVSNAACNKTLKRLTGKNVHPHSLRHTYASFLILKGIDLISISKILGHENLNITLKVYAHQLEKLENKNFKMVNSIFDGL